MRCLRMKYKFERTRVMSHRMFAIIPAVPYFTTIVDIIPEEKAFELCVRRVAQKRLTFNALLFLLLQFEVVVIARKEGNIVALDGERTLLEETQK